MIRYSAFTLWLDMKKKTFWIFMNFNENIRNDEKIAEKSRGYAYKINHISLAYCPRVLKLILK